MNVHKRYKMYKKGKKWCCMALTTFVAILGVLTTTEIANADIVTDPDQILKLRNGLRPDIKCHNRSVAGYCPEHIPE